MPPITKVSCLSETRVYHWNTWHTQCSDNTVKCKNKPINIAPVFYVFVSFPTASLPVQSLMQELLLSGGMNAGSQLALMAQRGRRMSPCCLQSGAKSLSPPFKFVLHPHQRHPLNQQSLQWYRQSHRRNHRTPIALSSYHQLQQTAIIRTSAQTLAPVAPITVPNGILWIKEKVDDNPSSNCWSHIVHV